MLFLFVLLFLCLSQDVFAEGKSQFSAGELYVFEGIPEYNTSGSRACYTVKEFPVN